MKHKNQIGQNIQSAINKLKVIKINPSLSEIYRLINEIVETENEKLKKELIS